MVEPFESFNIEDRRRGRYDYEIMQAYQEWREEQRKQDKKKDRTEYAKQYRMQNKEKLVIWKERYNEKRQKKIDILSKLIKRKVLLKLCYRYSLKEIAKFLDKNEDDVKEYLRIYHISKSNIKRGCKNEKIGC